MKIYGRMDNRGKLWIQRVNSIGDVQWVVDDIGRIIYAKSTDSLYFGGTSGWVKITDADDLFNIGQKLLFFSYPLPDGWTLKTDSSFDDRAVIITNDGGQVNSKGGSWVITGMQEQTLPHNHYAPLNVSQPTTFANIGSSDFYAICSDRYHRHHISLDGKHTHDFTGEWRMKWAKACEGEYTG